MLQHRVIPCLLLRNGGLVKTQKFKDAKYVGDPINVIRIFNDKEVDELIVLDIEASKANCEPRYDLIEQFAGECFMPLCYGGGITTVEQAKRLFSLGVEKVCVQTHALGQMRLVRDIADRFGSQSIVVSLDIKKNLLGSYRLWSSVSGKLLSVPWRDFLNQAVAAGAGEIMLTSVDREGTMSGMDLELIRAATQSCPVPVIASGGAGGLPDLRAAVEAGANAIAVGAMVTFHGPHRAVLITYPKYNELVRLLDK